MTGSGITLAIRNHVAESSNRALDSAIVMWRMHRPEGLRLHAVIHPRVDGAALAWYLNGRPLGMKDFTDWTSALHWSERLKAQNWAVGWRPESE
jgi:hypothetical protein